MADNTTLQGFRDDLDSRISAAKVNGFWTQAFKDQAINDAGKQVVNAYRWPFVELALKTQTRDASEYYDYPAAPNAFTSNSIYQITIEGEDYGSNDGRTRVSWGEFQKRKNNGDDSELIFSDHNGFYFLFPVPADGLELDVYGLKKWRKLVDPTDEAVTPDDLDDAVVKIALARCLRKAKKYAEAKAELVEVIDPNIGLLAMAWSKVHEESPGGYKGEAVSTRW